jgi:hypothetical protein
MGRVPALLVVLLSACARTQPQAEPHGQPSPQPQPPVTSLDIEAPRIVNAFFGLDHALPTEAAAMCREAPGKDGLPVTFSRRVVGPIDPVAFTVRLRSGALVQPACATTKPANAPAKDHTVLLIGELGSVAGDPPVVVQVTGHIALSGGADAHGLKAMVSPLREGPTLALALAVPAGTIPSDCPEGVRQIVVAVWAGGVTPSAGADQTTHLSGYRLTTETGPIRPFALGDLGDRDNYVHLCLRTEVRPTSLEFPAGILTDPNGDLNPTTSVPVSPQL